MAYCTFHEVKICSLCCSLESICHDSCKKESEYSLHKRIDIKISKIFSGRISEKAALRVFDFLGITSVLMFIVAVIAWMIFSFAVGKIDENALIYLKHSLTIFFLIISVFISTLVWWVLLLQESRKLTEDELEKQNETSAEKNKLFEKTEELVHIGSWKFNLANNSLSWTDEIYRIFEVDLSVEPSYELFLKSIYPDDRDKVNQAYNDSLKDKQNYEITHRLLMQDGRVKYVKEKCETSFDSLGKPLISIGTVHDITEQKLLEDKLKNSQMLMMQQSRLASMGEMIVNISHQWRQPLNTLGLIIQKQGLYQSEGMLTSERLNDSIEKCMKIIKGMSSTIDDFRNFFNPNREKEYFSVVEAIEKSYAIVSATFEHYNIKYIMHTNNKDYKVYGFMNEFSQVIINILNNSKDVLVEREVTSGKVTINLTKDENNKIIISICDNGGGISESVIPKVFEPYFTTKEEGKGTGIGLYMSKTIVREHMNGSLNVSNVNDGACFTIILDE